MKKNKKKKIIKISHLSTQALKTLYYIMSVLFLFQCGLMIAYLNLIEPWHVLVLEFTGLSSILLNIIVDKIELDSNNRSANKEDDNEN